MNSTTPLREMLIAFEEQIIAAYNTHSPNRIRAFGSAHKEAEAKINQYIKTIRKRDEAWFNAKFESAVGEDDIDHQKGQWMPRNPALQTTIEMRNQIRKEARDRWYRSSK
jgi:hypothetical protein